MSSLIWFYFGDGTRLNRAPAGGVGLIANDINKNLMPVLISTLNYFAYLENTLA